jgi:hypothetical protein
LAGISGCALASACGPDWDELDPSADDDAGGASSSSSGSGATGAGAAGGGGSCDADDGLACTEDACVDGVPEHDPLPAGAPCGGGRVCDGSGQCVECVQDDDCPGAKVCVDGACSSCNQPETCASLGLTCGLAQDGCGGTLDCDNGVLDGTETDVDCGGGCGQQCATGADCGVGADCVSGFCADGVCCNSACTATCMACNLVAAVGTCMNTPQLQEDANGAMVCTLTNACDGLGACKKDTGQPCAADTECASGNCLGAMCE